LNGGSSNASRSASSGAETPPGWVARNDRHRQLINANIYEQDTQNREKAIEKTRQTKMNGYRQREKTQFNEFLKHQAGASSTQTNPAGQNELTIQGVQFRVMDGGKKLVKIPGMSKSKMLLTFVPYLSQMLPTHPIELPRLPLLRGSSSTEQKQATSWLIALLTTSGT
jgi:hypothetical protein